MDAEEVAEVADSNYTEEEEEAEAENPTLRKFLQLANMLQAATESCMKELIARHAINSDTMRIRVQIDRAIKECSIT